MQLLVRNLHANVGFAIFVTPHCEVCCTVLFALCKGIPQHHASILEATVGFYWVVFYQAAWTAVIMSTWTCGSSVVAKLL